MHIALHTQIVVPAHPHWTLDTDEKQSPLPEELAETLEELAEKPISALCCVSCLHHITSDAERIEVNSQHHHHCTNPQGFQFDIGCFANAYGCHGSGQWTLDYSWFQGYLWRYALCTGCQAHLGWHYQNGQDAFFGLILSRLVRSSER